MPIRLVLGDVVTLGNTFEVDGVATDPTTVSLTVTSPAGVATTYTYAAAQITKTATGVYSKIVTPDATGTWTYKWVGTGAAADVEDGSFDIWAAAAGDLLNLLTLGEAKNAINIPTDETGHDDELRQYVAAISRRIDQLCGPVVIRSVSGELHDGATPGLFLRHRPVAAITSVSENGTALASTDYLLDPGLGILYRRSGDSDIAYYTGRQTVSVTYTAGRYATTAAVDPLFKLAAASVLRRLWARESGGWARTPNFLTDETAPLPFFTVVDQVVNEFLAHELLGPVIA